HLPPRLPFEESQPREHRHLAGRDMQGMPHELFRQLERRVRDDVRGAGLVIEQEVYAAVAIASVDEIRAGDGIARVLQYLGDRTVTACRFPDVSLELLDAQKGFRGARRRRVKIVPLAVRTVRDDRADPRRGGLNCCHRTLVTASRLNCPWYGPRSV